MTDKIIDIENGVNPLDEILAMGDRPESKFWKPEAGKRYTIQLTNFRKEEDTDPNTHSKREWWKADVVSVDGESLSNKVFSTTSLAWKRAITPVMRREVKDTSDLLKISMKKIGTGMNLSYDIEVVK